jgi:hypothetical protein
MQRRQHGNMSSNSLCGKNSAHWLKVERPLFGTDPDRNRATWETPAVKQFLSVESHLGVRASYATRRKRRYEASKCGWTQPLFRKARDHGIN